MVIGQRLGALLKEWDATGGLDTTALRKLLEKSGAGARTDESAKSPALGSTVL